MRILVEEDLWLRWAVRACADRRLWVRWRWGRRRLWRRWAALPRMLAMAASPP